MANKEKEKEKKKPKKKKKRQPQKAVPVLRKGGLVLREETESGGGARGERDDKLPPTNANRSEIERERSTNNVRH